MKKRNKIEEAYEFITDRNYNIETIDELVTEIKKRSKSRMGNENLKKKVIELLEMQPSFGYVLTDDEQLVSKKKLFAKTKFKVKLTDEECENKQLVFGHRHIPFGNTFSNQVEITVVDKNNKEIPKFFARKKLEEIYIYFSLQFDLLSNFSTQDDLQEFNIPVFDLKDWMQAENFKTGDQLLVSIVDFDKGIYKIEKITKKELDENVFINKNKDRLLEAAVVEFLETYGSAPILAVMLHAFAQCEPSVVEAPGTAFGAFSTSSELFSFENTAYGTILKLTNDTSFEEAWENILEGDIPEQGVSKDLEGILQELGSSFTEDFILAKMKEQVIEHNQIDAREIAEILFKNHAPFSNEKQAKNFENAFNKASASINLKWKNVKVENQKLKALKQVLDFKIEFVNFLRKLDSIIDPENFNPSVMAPLQEFDHMTDNLLHLFNSLSPAEFNKDKEFTEVAGPMEQFIGIFRNVSHDILIEVQGK